MLDLGFDVILVIMDTLSLQELSYMMRTCKMLHHTGMPLLVRMGASRWYYFDKLLAFLRFLLVDPHIRASHLHQFIIKDTAWIRHSEGSPVKINAAMANQILPLLEQMFTHANNLVRLEVVDRSEWFFSSANIVNTVVGNCHSITQLDISAWLSWKNAHLLVGTLNCPLRSLRIYHPTSMLSNDVVNTLPLDILSSFKDTLEELEIIGARLVIGATEGRAHTWPRVHFLRIHVRQNEALLAQSFPNVRSLFIYENGKPNAASQGVAGAPSWRNLDMVYAPPDTFSPISRCRTRLLSTWVPPHGFQMERFQSMLKTSSPSVLSLSLAPYNSSDVIKAVSSAVPRLRCLRLISTMDRTGGSEAVPLMVNRGFDSYPKA
jgi:hypothetical protein